LAAVFDCGVEEFFGEVLRVGAVPDGFVVGAGDVDAAAGADGFGEGTTLGDIGEVRAPG
jgi:hypothetical protein